MDLKTLLLVTERALRAAFPGENGTRLRRDLGLLLEPDLGELPLPEGQNRDLVMAEVFRAVRAYQPPPHYEPRVPTSSSGAARGHDLERVIQELEVWLRKPNPRWTLERFRLVVERAAKTGRDPMEAVRKQVGSPMEVDGVGSLDPGQGMAPTPAGYDHDEYWIYDNRGVARPELPAKLCVLWLTRSTRKTRLVRVCTLEGLGPKKKWGDWGRFLVS